MKSVLTLILLTFAAALQASTPDGTADTLRIYQLNEVVVRADRIDLVQRVGTSDLSAARISARDPQNALQTLQFVPGLFLSHNARNEGTLMLRGFDQRQISVFLDGIPISMAYDGLVDVSQLVGDNIASVLINKGFSSLLYGANTLGGTVQWVTINPTERKKLQLRFEGSDQTGLFASAGHQGSFGRLWYALNGAWAQADRFDLPSSFVPSRNEDGGARDNSAYEKKSANGKLLFNLHPHHAIGLNFSLIDNWYQAPVNALSNSPRFWRFPEWKRNLLGLHSTSTFSDRFSLRTAWFFDRYRNTLQSYDDATFTTQTRKYAFASYYDDFSYGAIAYPSWNLLSLGATQVMISYKMDVHRQRSKSSAPFEGYGMETWALSAEQDLQLSGRTEMLIGAGANYLRPTEAYQNALRDPITQFNGQFGIQYRLHANLHTHLAAAYKSRFPTLKELYSERLGNSIANPDLKSEYTQNCELSMVWQRRSLRMQGTLFLDRLQNLITRNELGKNTFQMQNVSQSRMQGFEWQASCPYHQWGIEINYTYLQARDLSPERNSDFLAYRPSHCLNGLFHWRIVRSLDVTMELSYVGERHGQDGDTGEWLHFPGYTLANAKVGWQIQPHCTLYSRLNNLGDICYESEYGLPMPGREWNVGVRLQL